MTPRSFAFDGVLQLEPHDSARPSPTNSPGAAT